MEILWGVVIGAMSLLCWGGQTLALFAPATGARLGITEARESVEPVFWADVRGEALWDFFTLWTALVAGVLLAFDNTAWAYFGLFGGGAYVYFAGRGIFARAAMLRRGFRIGAQSDVRTGMTFLFLWGVMGIAMSAAAVVALSAE